MKHATRFNALARQAGGVALSVAHAGVLSLGLMGMAHVATDGDWTRLQFEQTFSLAAEEPTAITPTAAELAMTATATDRVVPPVSALTPVEPAPRIVHSPVKLEVKGLAALAEDPFAQDEGELSLEMAKVRDWITDTYRVSETTIVPALAAAEASAQELGFDPLLIVAIMAVESSFNPRAVSNMGAQGLMQVIPRYHQDKIAPHRGKNVLFDPEVNVRVGTLVLHEGLQRYGSLQRALQYYNGALKDPKARYTRKVMALKKRLMTIAGRDTTRTSLEQAS
ncbi:transglycosylase SLT domain-containing protein [Thauera sp. WH-1]|uniref:transglycosylase SLT domain-containing protein n=1 Tax=Thauera sp. WH-1 TaxID=3398230 RepID=UPI0039FBA9D7